MYNYLTFYLSKDFNNYLIFNIYLYYRINNFISLPFKFNKIYWNYLALYIYIYIDTHIYTHISGVKVPPLPKTPLH